MREADFKTWLGAQKYKPATINTRLSDLRAIEKYYGNLDLVFAEDGFSALRAELAYTAADRDVGRENPSRMPLWGDINRDLAHLRATLKTYERFLRGETGDPDSPPTSLTVEAIHASMDECDDLGSSTFLAQYGFGQPRDYWVLRDAARYPAKAIVGVAYKFVGDGQVRRSSEFSGGVGPTGAATLLRRLGFEVVGNASDDAQSATWFVTARDGDRDGLAGFLEREEWSLLHDGRYSAKVHDMRPGDRIVMRDYTSRSPSPPFETDGVAVSSMSIRATGTITENRGDGLAVAVAWDPPGDPRTWYFYTNNETIWRLPAKVEAEKLIAFTFDGTAQDYAWWLAQPYWASRMASGRSDKARVTSDRDPTNLIFYGPPGTGKTFETARAAVELCTGDDIADRETLMAEYRRLGEEGRIEFVTFHQSYSYEDFIEGLRPMQGGDGEATAGFSLEPVPGVFRRIVQRALASKGGGTGHIDLGSRNLFKMSLGDATRADRAFVFEQALEQGYAYLGYEDIDWTDDRFSTQQGILDECRARGVRDGKLSPQSGPVEGPHRFRNEVQVGDLIVVTKGLKLFRAIGEVIGDYEYAPREEGEYCHRRRVRWLWDDPLGVPFEEIKDKQFSQETIYPLRRSDLKIAALERYANSGQAGSGEGEPFVIIIDEINRANISKVFGELIALIETDKRIGMLNELTVRLPYSREHFGVPSNLHLIGTMNTADRSIALLDTALRRRFEFRELMPQAETLREASRRTGLDLVTILTRINEHIEYLFDREHQIGHAYLIHCQTVTDVDQAMRHKVIPLLAEYFYEDWSKVALVLGDHDENREGDSEGGFLDRKKVEPPRGLAGDAVDAPPRYRWSVREAFSYDRLL